MSLRPRGAPLLIVALLASLAWTTARAADRGSPLVGVADFLSAFAAAYQPDDYNTMLLLEADAAVHRADLALAPEVTFEQRLGWNAYSTLDLDLDASLRMPLYDSRARPNLALADAGRDAALASVAAARTAAELSFFVDLATYAALTEAAAAVAPALERFDAAPWLTQPGFDTLGLDPAARSSYEAHVRLRDMLTFLVEQLTEVKARLARALAVDAERLVAPSPAAIRAAVPQTGAEGACLASAPAVAAARLRHRQATLATALDATAPITVGLTGSVAVGTAAEAGTPWSWSTAASFAVEARVALPPQRGPWQDVDGILSATASSAGASQSLRITWPRPPHKTFLYPDPDAALAAELHDIAVTLRGLRRAAAQTTSERERLERSLDWLLLDSFGAAFTNERAVTTSRGRPTAAALQAGLPPDTVPGLAAQVADLSAQLAFAELDEVIAGAQLASTCGAFP